MHKSVAEATPGYLWEVGDDNWVSIVFREDGGIVIFNDEGICEYDGEENKVLLEFLDNTSIFEGPVLNGGPLPDVKPKEIIKWELGAMPGKPSAPAHEPSVVNVAIAHIQYDGAVARTEADEYVEIANQGESAVELSGWQLHSEGVKQVFTFPQGTVIAPGQSIRVYTNQIHQKTGGFSFGSNRAIWHNQGDVAQLTDPSGEVKSRYSYGNKKTAA